MGWREREQARQYIATEKAKVRAWRDAELKTAEAKRKADHRALEDNHKLEVDQIKNSAIEQFVRLDDQLRDMIEGAQR